MRTFRGPARASLPERLDALAAAAEDADGRLPAELVDHARVVVNRAGDRRRLSGDHTVVALAGPTGSGKSSLFNAVTGLELARVGVRRPTTSEPLACIWGVQGAAELLDWLGVPRQHQVPKESVLDSGEADALEGLILVDMPDHDSTDTSHRDQVDRLTTMVDMFVWVVDPQKYADAAMHERYLQPLAGHGAVTVLLLNQIDTLTPADVKTCVDDLQRLLSDDGFPKVPIVPTSAINGAGLDEFVGVLRGAVAERRACDDRLAADISEAAGTLLDTAGRGDPAGVSEADRRQLVEALSDAAGVDLVAKAVGTAYRQRARAATGWPLTRWLARLRPDPLRRLGVSREDADTTTSRPSLPAPTPVQRARAQTAVRTLADAAAAKAPTAWKASIRSTAAEAAARLPSALDEAVRATDLGTQLRPRWWMLVGALQWLLLAATAAGAGWLVVLAVVGWLQLPEVPTPSVGVLPVPTLLLLGGAVLGMLVGVLTRLAARTGGLRRSISVRRRLRDAVAGTAEEVVVTPVSAEVERLQSFRTAAAVARG